MNSTVLRLIARTRSGCGLGMLPLLTGAVLVLGCDAFGPKRENGGGSTRSDSGSFWNLTGPKESRPERPAATREQLRPDEDVWAIRCIKLDGRNHIVVSENYENALRNVRGLNPDLVQVFHDDRESVVYYGRYQREYAVASNREQFSPDPAADLALIRQLSFRDGATGQDVWPFRLADIDALPTSQLGDPQWDLAQADGYWTVHVAVFYNEGEMNRRKFAAVEYCRLLRERGVEAYYHHGPVNSSVCVGLFPKDSVANVSREDRFTGEITAVNKVVDPRMIKVMKDFPESLENGHRMFEITRDPATGAVTRKTPIPSFPALTPKAEVLTS